VINKKCQVKAKAHSHGFFRWHWPSEFRSFVFAGSEEPLKTFLDQIHLSTNQHVLELGEISLTGSLAAFESSSRSFRTMRGCCIGSVRREGSSNRALIILSAQIHIQQGAAHPPNVSAVAITRRLHQKSEGRTVDFREALLRATVKSHVGQNVSVKRLA